MGWDEEEYNGVRWRRGEEGGRTVCEWRKGGSFRGGIGVPGDDGGVNVRFWRRCMVRACLSLCRLSCRFCLSGLLSLYHFPKS